MVDGGWLMVEGKCGDFHRKVAKDTKKNAARRGRRRPTKKGAREND